LTQNAIIIGASSGIGASLAADLSEQGWTLGIAARRTNRLGDLASKLPTRTVVARVDVTHQDDAMNQIRSLITKLGDVRLFIISAGTGHENPDLQWELEQDTLATNVLGFAAMANVAAEHLMTQQRGTLVGISSIAAVRGHGDAPAYGASKAFVSHYLQSLRHRFAKRQLPITVLEAQPGFVDTAMAKGDGLFWVSSPQKASAQILAAIKRRRTHVYVTRRWRLIAWLLRWLPNFLYNRL